MRRIQYAPAFLLATLTLLLSGAVPGFAQRTVVQDAGGGRKLELHYDAAGQVTETQTLGPDGKLLQKDVLEYSPGGAVPQTVSTSYWPNGQVHRMSRNTYDNNSNFTEEYIQLFDETGKQIAGHRLTHNPQTGQYSCLEWNVAAQAYKPRECPAGEESSGTPETVKTFTQDEVMQQLARARQAKEKPGTQSSAPGQAAPSAMKEVALVFPAHVRPNEPVSGSVVEDPSRYEGMPEVSVTRVSLPLAPSGLAGWQVQLSGEPPQPADGAIKLTIPPGTLELAVTFQQSGNAGAPISKSISVPGTPRPKAKNSKGYRSPAICFKHQLCMISGAFSGDSGKTFAAFEDRPARIIAETTEAIFVAVPERTEPGLRPLVVAEGSKAIAFPMIVGSIEITPAPHDLTKDETVVMTAAFYGAEELPDAEWVPGNYPASSLAEAQKLVPGFQMPRADRDAHERKEAEEKRVAEKKSGAKSEGEEGEGGQILLVVQNASPDQVTLRDAKNGHYVFNLNADSFKMGEFKYKFVVQGIKAGDFAVQAHVVPLLASVTGQQFPLTGSSAGK